MGTAKKCYKCMTEAEEGAKACSRCGAKLGPRTGSGIAAKPGSPLLKIALAAAALALIGKFALHSRSEAPAQTPALDINTGVPNAKDGAIQKIKEKAAKDLDSVGVADIGYNGDTLCVYVDQRFAGLTRTQQEQLLAIVAGEWEKAIGKTSTAVKVLEYGTEKTLADLVV